jgi:hypothetical protein
MICFFMQITEGGAIVPQGEDQGFTDEATPEEIREIEQTGNCWREIQGQTWIGQKVEQ